MLRHPDIVGVLCPTPRQLFEPRVRGLSMRLPEGAAMAKVDLRPFKEPF